MAMTLTVSQWRFCVRCHAMFHDGSVDKGVCGAGGAHQAMGFDFDLPQGAGTPTAQTGWRRCGRCRVLFFDGYADKGTCKAGGGHRATGPDHALPHDVPGTHGTQDQWRYCGGCHCMFYDGYPNKGACPNGDGGHSAIGYLFVLPLMRASQGFEGIPG